MKRYAALLLTLVCAFALPGCMGQNEGKTTEVTETGSYFEATVLEISDTSLLVEPAEGTPERKSADRIAVGTASIGEEQSLDYLAEAKAGDIVEIGYTGGIAESYPAQISGAFKVRATAGAGALHDRIPMVMVKGRLYYDTGKESAASLRCGVMDGKIDSTVDRTQVPTEDNQSNFGAGYEYQYGAEGAIEIYMNDKWFVFEQRDDA